MVLQPTKTAMTLCDIDPGRWIEVLASIFMPNFCDGQWLPTNHLAVFQQSFRRRFKLFFILAQLVQSETAVNFMSNEVCFARSMHSTSQVGKTSQV